MSTQAQDSAGTHLPVEEARNRGVEDALHRVFGSSANTLSCQERTREQRERKRAEEELVQAQHYRAKNRKLEAKLSKARSLQAELQKAANLTIDGCNDRAPAARSSCCAAAKALPGVRLASA